jgi:hypothetical protein
MAAAGFTVRAGSALEIYLKVNDDDVVGLDLIMNSFPVDERLCVMNIALLFGCSTNLHS